MARVLVAGSFNVDHVWRVATLPVAGATLSGSYSTGPGGKGFNQAVAARRAGASTRFVCALGDDAGARLAHTLCAADGIDLQATVTSQPTGTAGIYVDAQGRNCIVIAPGANGALDAARVGPALADVNASDVVLVQLESPLDAIACALDAARAAGATAVLNPAPANIAIDAALLARADILTPNETEFCALVACHIGQRVEADAVAGLSQSHLHALCRSLLPNGCVVVTLGANGCFVSHPQDKRRGDGSACYHLPAEPAQAIDTTGAGDAFTGALAAALACRPGMAFIEHARFAGRFAARSTERAGAALAMPYLTV